MSGQALARHDVAPVIHPHRVKHVLCDIDPEDVHLWFHGTRLLWLNGFTDLNSLWLIAVDPHRGGSISLRPDTRKSPFLGNTSLHATVTVVEGGREGHSRIYQLPGPSNLSILGLNMPMVC